MLDRLDRFARIESARLERTGDPGYVYERSRAPQREPHFGTRAMRKFLTTPKTFTRGGLFGVVKEYSDGNQTVVESGMSWEAAEELAGRMRDEMSDHDVGLGMNFVAAKTVRL